MVVVVVVDKWNVCSGDLVGVPLKKERWAIFFSLWAPCARTNKTNSEEPPQP